VARVLGDELLLVLARELREGLEIAGLVLARDVVVGGGLLGLAWVGCEIVAGRNGLAAVGYPTFAMQALQAAVTFTNRLLW